jgi:hypothetical protein
MFVWRSSGGLLLGELIVVIGRGAAWSLAIFGASLGAHRRTTELASRPFLDDVDTTLLLLLVR